MPDEHKDIEETASQPLPSSKSIPLYQPDEFQEYLALDAASELAEPSKPAFPHVWTSYTAPSSLLAPSLPEPVFRQKGIRGKSILIAVLALLLVASVGGGFLFYALRLYPRSIQHVVPSPIPSSPQALFKQVTSRKPALNDLFNNEGTSTWSSPPNQSADGQCTFEADGYHIVDEKDGTFYYCISQGSFLVNFAFQAQLTILSGDGASVIFRGSQLLNKFYRFRIDQYGYYGLYLSDDPSSNVLPTPLREGLSQTINAGLGQTNVLTVIAIGSDIYLYANSHFIVHVRDNTLSEGQIGLSASDYSKTTEVVFQHAEVWTL
jgi:hypothetical protein